MVPEGLINHNFLFYILMNAFSEFFSRWFTWDMKSTLSHYPAETAIPIPRQALICILSINFSHFWPIPRDVLIEGSAD